MTVWTIVVAAGTGARFGRAKQFEPLGSRLVVEHSLHTAASVSDGVVLVLPPDDVDVELDEPDGAAVVRCAGGASRSASVRAGLACVPADTSVVLVHDGARPLASPGLFESVVRAVRQGAVAVVPGIPVSDTVRRIGGGVVDRSELVAVQTPQGFAAPELRAAHAGGAEATDDASLVEAAGGEVVLVPGETTNLKLTTPQDRVVAEALVAEVGVT